MIKMNGTFSEIIIFTNPSAQAGCDTRSIFKRSLTGLTFSEIIAVVTIDMKLNNLMVRLQQCWSLGECRVPLHCHRSLVQFGPEWYYLIRILSMG